MRRRLLLVSLLPGSTAHSRTARRRLRVLFAQGLTYGAGQNRVSIDQNGKLGVLP
jgi:hypothetical protein